MKDDELEATKATGTTGGLQGIMTARLAARQFGLLFLLATALLCISFFINFYGLLTFQSMWDNLPLIQYKFIVIHPVLLFVYGYVLFNGVVFALGPSERSFNFFFSSMILALLVVNYDHSIIDWFTMFGAGVKAAIIHVNHPFKILFAGLFFLVLVIMHYNILSDDFARRMLRRGVPTEEVAQIRAGMFQAAIPAILTASVIAFVLSIVAWFAGFIFRDVGLFIPKLELVLLAALFVPIAFLLRGILKDLAGKRSGNGPKGGPNG